MLDFAELSPMYNRVCMVDGDEATHQKMDDARHQQVAAHLNGAVGAVAVVFNLQHRADIVTGCHWMQAILKCTRFALRAGSATSIYLGEAQHVGRDGGDGVDDLGALALELHGGVGAAVVAAAAIEAGALADPTAAVRSPRRCLSRR